jgi:hypothetical protein
MEIGSRRMAAKSQKVTKIGVSILQSGIESLWARDLLTAS